LTVSIDLFDFFDWTNQPVGAQSSPSGRFASRREDAKRQKFVATQMVEATPAAEAVPVPADRGA
jgi:hypothetical protein